MVFSQLPEGRRSLRLWLRRRLQLLDALYVVLTVIFFASLIGYTLACERMGGGV